MGFHYEKTSGLAAKNFFGRNKQGIQPPKWWNWPWKFHRQIGPLILDVSWFEWCWTTNQHNDRETRYIFPAKNAFFLGFFSQKARYRKVRIHGWKLDRLGLLYATRLLVWNWLAKLCPTVDVLPGHHPQCCNKFIFSTEEMKNKYECTYELKIAWS